MPTLQSAQGPTRAPATTPDSIVLSDVANRLKQMRTNGFDAAHDAEHDNGELLSCAEAHIKYAEYQQTGVDDVKTLAENTWPFEGESFTPADSAIENLVEAAAFILADVVRLRRETEDDET